MNTCCIVVIGHVDHGKTALVKALTGVETDRLAEEKARGLSIKTGFAHHSYPTGVADFVDAPGHEDFIQAMITGATGAQAVLMVISAVEGIAAQTLEHLKIAGLLGINKGVIAVTKSDLLPPDEQAARLADIRQALVRTPLADAPLVPCSAHSGAGIDGLHTQIAALLSDPPEVAAPLHGFLPVDRVFTLEGRGTVVTGTLLGGDLALGDALVLQPTGQPVTLRSLQSRGETRADIQAGERMAANLRGVAVADVPKGAVLCRGEEIKPSSCIDVVIDLPSDTARPLKHMQDLRVFFGTTSAVASLRLYGGGQLGASQTGFAQLRFKTPVVGFAGQHAILRRLSPAETVGGAVFLDPQATPVKSRDSARIDVLQATRKGHVKDIANALSVAGKGICDAKDIARLARLPRDAIARELGSGFTFLTDTEIAPDDGIAAAETQIQSALAAYHAQFPVRPFAPRNVIIPAAMAPVLSQHVQAIMRADGQLRTKNGMLAAFDHDPVAQLDQDQRARMAEIETHFHDAGLDATRTPVDEKADANLLALLIDAGAVLALQNVALNQTLLLHADTLTAAAEILNRNFPAPQEFTTSAARRALETSRRVIVPVLEHFDSLGITARTGNSRRMTLNEVPLPAAQG
ncbi:selenocysteine-specific translation elongation factor [Sulfitobacter geojensis]|uniref:selenocysteine-specific translation elongation factor n=1 Tax=Sulfitobacter geojensis TaxID=1342299 RepID=UPI002490C0CD|nr:selenocysteine-specific translation elongation factor [Sulfitobacter geojensis]